MHTKHTPGPWYADKIEDRNAYNIFKHGGTSALLTVSGIGFEVQHDARLIAAAPELLAALQHALKDMEMVRKVEAPSSLLVSIGMARTAIAKALRQQAWPFPQEPTQHRADLDRALARDAATQARADAQQALAALPEALL